MVDSRNWLVTRFDIKRRLNNDAMKFSSAALDYRGHAGLPAGLCPFNA